MSALRLVLDLASVCAVGFLATLTFLPALAGGPNGVWQRMVRGAVAAACVVVAVALALLVATLGAVLDASPMDALRSGEIGRFLRELTSGRALLAQAVLLAASALVAWRARTRATAAVALLLASAGTATLALGGHAASSADHVLAILVLVAHVLAAAFWIGGLSGLCVLASSDRVLFRDALPAFSALALWCAVTVGGSGVLGGMMNLNRVEDLWGSSYGALLVLKSLAFVVLVRFGVEHRRRLIRDSTALPGLFLRLAIGELAVMGAAVGLAVALARSAPPGGHAASTGPAGLDAPSAAGLIGAFRADAFGLPAVVLCTVLYLAGLNVLRRRGDSWPARRSALFFCGVAALFLVTCTGIGEYALALFSVHMIQHMTLNMIAPLLLLLGAPMTLALRSLGPRARSGLLRFIESRPLRVLAHPIVSTAFFVAGLYVLYFTPLFEAAMQNHWGHLLMQAHFFLAGLLFFWYMVAVDPIPRSLGQAPRVPLLVLVVVAHTVFAMVLVFGSTVLGGDYFRDLELPWRPPLLEDQALGGALAWFLGETTTVAVLVWIILRWFAAAERADQAAMRRRLYSR